MNTHVNIIFFYVYWIGLKRLVLKKSENFPQPIMKRGFILNLWVHVLDGYFRERNYWIIAFYIIQFIHTFKCLQSNFFYKCVCLSLLCLMIFVTYVANLKYSFKAHLKNSLNTPRQKSIRALEIVLAIFLCFECHFLSFYACYKEYKA